MNVYVLMDNEDKEKYELKVQEIIEELKNYKNYIKHINKVSNIEEIRENSSLCMLFTNNKENIKKVSKITDVICITDKLESEYILSIIDDVKDIFFLNSSVQEITNRILGYIKIKQERKKCIKGDMYAFKK